MCVYVCFSFLFSIRFNDFSSDVCSYSFVKCVCKAFSSFIVVFFLFVCYYVCLRFDTVVI